MKILLVNDDGYLFPNIVALEEVLKEYGDVYVVAPSTGMSGAGCSLSTFYNKRVYKEDDHHYHVDGTPVDCVQYAECLIGDVDLVVSGVNKGWNLSNDIMYSGTCGATFQSLMFKRNAIALSADFEESIEKIKYYSKLAIDHILENNLLSKEYFLNVNFPLAKFEKEKGIKFTKVYIRRGTYSLEVIDPNDNLYLLHRDNHDINNDDNYDVSAIQNGYISISPLGVSTYKDEYLDDLKKRAHYGE